MLAFDPLPSYRTTALDTTSRQPAAEPIAPGADWEDAACRDDSKSAGRLFFSDQNPDIIEARRICASCALAEPCLAGAVERREPWGVWGGQLFADGKIVTQKRRRGRPPKNPPPGYQMTA